jgi:hypothetical protein
VNRRFSLLVADKPDVLLRVCSLLLRRGAVVAALVDVRDVAELAPPRPVVEPRVVPAPARAAVALAHEPV